MSFDTHDYLALVLPTVRNKTFNHLFVESLDNFKEMKEFCTINLNFQSPWSLEEAHHTVDLITSKGFKVNYSFNSYDTDIPSAFTIRNDCVIDNTNSYFYEFMDDEMSFRGPTSTVPYSAGQQHLQILDYMLKFRDCGVLKLGNSLVRNPPKFHIGIIDHRRDLVVGRGLVFSNLRKTSHYADNFSPLFPDEAVSLLGGDEEKLAAGARYIAGQYLARMGFSKIAHYENQIKSEKDKLNPYKVIPGKEASTWVTDEVKEAYSWKFMRENYFIPDDKKRKGNFSKSGVFISDSLYRGLDPDDGIISSSHTIDYEYADYDHIMNELRKFNY